VDSTLVSHAAGRIAHPQARADLFESLEAFYNEQRRHG